MHLPFALFFFLLCNPTALADFLGPTYPAPIDLTSEASLVRIAWENFTSTFDSYLKENETTASGPLAGLQNVTFSLGLFSIHDSAASDVQYHYVSPEIATTPNGTNVVDGDSIYRVASVTKLFTVYAGLIELADEDWHRPITDFVPELAEYAQRDVDKEDRILTTQWDEITLWVLASQLGSITQIGWTVNDQLFLAALTALAPPEQQVPGPVESLGFPPLDLGVLGPCNNLSNPVCSTEDFIGSLSIQPPTFLPWTSPAYSDAAFMLLGLAIANATGKPIETVYRESVFEPLGMASSSATIPSGEAEIARSVIAGDPTLGFAADAPFTTPSGGIFSTINDLNRFGIGLLNSTLLPVNRTRKWMKPITHTASLSYSIGAPWEIIRYLHPSTGKITDLYTKLGDSGNYGGITVVIPDYNAGFSMLDAYSIPAVRSEAANLLLDYVTEAYLPALEAQAASEATRNYVGTYASADANLNSSLIIAFNESTVEGVASGLSIDTWISNGTDVLASSLFNGVKPRILPTIPNQSCGPGQVAFQASMESQVSVPTPDLGIGPFSGQYGFNFDWLLVDQRHYGGIAIDLFVFDVDEKGRATAASPAVTRAKLERRE